VSPSISTGASNAVIPAQTGISSGGARSSAFAEDDGWGQMNQVEGDTL
jgi:hypothetical protein